MYVSHVEHQLITAIFVIMGTRAAKAYKKRTGAPSCSMYIHKKAVEIGTK